MELKSNYMNAIDLDMRKQLRNKYVNAIKRAKCSYFANLATTLSNSGGVFKVLNNRENKRDLKIKSPSSGNIVTDDSVVAEIFKSTFESKVAKLKRISSSNLAPL